MSNPPTSSINWYINVWTKYYNCAINTLYDSIVNTNKLHKYVHKYIPIPCECTHKHYLQKKKTWTDLYPFYLSTISVSALRPSCRRGWLRIFLRCFPSPILWRLRTRGRSLVASWTLVKLPSFGACVQCQRISFGFLAALSGPGDVCRASRLCGRSRICWRKGFCWTASKMLGCF